MSTGSNFNGWIIKINEIVVSSIEDSKKEDKIPSSNSGGNQTKGAGNSDKLIANPGGISPELGGSSSESGGISSKSGEVSSKSGEVSSKSGGISSKSGGISSKFGKSSPESSGISSKFGETSSKIGGISSKSGGISPESENPDEKLVSSSSEDEKTRILDMNKDTLSMKSFFATNAIIASKFRQKIEAERGNLQKAEPLSVDILNNRSFNSSGLTATFKNVKAYNMHSFQIKEVVADKTKGIISYQVTFPYINLKADVAIAGASISWKGGPIDIKFVEPSSKGDVRFQIDPTPKMLGIDLGYEYKRIEVTGTSTAKEGAFLAQELDKYLTQNKKDIIAKAKQAIMKALDSVDQAAHVA